MPVPESIERPPGRARADQPPPSPSGSEKFQSMAIASPSEFHWSPKLLVITGEQFVWLTVQVKEFVSALAGVPSSVTISSTA